MIGRLLQAADFKRLLAVPPAFRSAHFAVHHLVETPVRVAYVPKNSSSSELSTAHQESCPHPVEDSRESPHLESPAKGIPRWVGCVVPKRHARRAVTRNLIKRQIYAAAGRAESALPEGMWLVRLRHPYASTAYPSAASDALRAAVRLELDRLLVKAAGQTGGGAASNARNASKRGGQDVQAAPPPADATNPGPAAP
jgi:ribonuclease P protein component